MPRLTVRRPFEPAPPRPAFIELCILALEHFYMFSEAQFLDPTWWDTSVLTSGFTGWLLGESISACYARWGNLEYSEAPPSSICFSVE